MELRALGPSGAFTVPDDARDVTLIAGGSGITPIVSIAETLRRARPDVAVRVLYGNRGEDDIIFRERLDALDAPVTHVLEAPPEGWSGLAGRLDAETIRGWLGDDAPERRYFVCGPEAMMDAVREALFAAGVDPRRIHEERFRSPDDAPRSDARLPTEPVTMRVRAGGRSRVAPVAPGETLLEAGLAAGASMPFSCAMGGCAACKCKVVSGEVVMAEPNCLSEAERADGWVLACSSRPLTDVAVEVP